jgi:hypothetical protein
MVSGKIERRSVICIFAGYRCVNILSQNYETRGEDNDEGGVIQTLEKARDRNLKRSSFSGNRRFVPLAKCKGDNITEYKMERAPDIKLIFVKPVS